MIPPSALQITEYLALPTFMTAMLPASAAFRNVAASGPSTQTSPMWERSNSPAASRTAWCSASSEPYFSGMSQPPKSVKFAPSASCSPCRGVCFGVVVVSVLTGSPPFVGFRGSGSVLECLGGRAGADQVPVASGTVDATHRGEVLVLAQARHREGALLAGVLAVPVAGDHGRRGVR